MSWSDEEFADIYNELYPGLCRFLERMLGQSGAAQELAQECFLRLFKNGNIPALEARYWTYRVGRNLALNALERRQTRNRLIDKVAATFRIRGRNPEEALAAAEDASRLQTALLSLPEPQRAALLLREQEGMPYKEIARVLGVSESKIKVDIFRARQSLQRMLIETPLSPAPLRTEQII